MEPGLVLSQKNTQSLILTHQMEQSIRILEMDTLELREYIQTQALENPAIDIDSVTEQSSEDLRKKKLEWLEQQAQNDKQYVGYYDGQSDFSLEKVAATPDGESLVDALLRQADHVCRREDLPVVRHAVGFVDADGYLRASAAEMAQGTDWSGAQLEQAVRTIQGFEPPGVGAADLRQCLLLQLTGPGRELARAIVETHLESVARGSVGRVATSLGVSRREAEQAIALIRSLNPRPGGSYTAGSNALYITPDVVVTAFQDRYYVMPCEFSYPGIRISASMEKLLADTSDDEAVQYIQQKIKQAQWVQKCIASRTNTLLTVAKSIVRHQERFFRYGPQHLSVLRMSDVAADLAVHESTVSRAVKNKYLQCAHGTFPLRHFFVQGLKGPPDRDAVSSHAVKHRIKELVEQEPPGSPLSDQKLADILRGSGIEISRRTVAKYRDEIGIPKSSYRR